MQSTPSRLGKYNLNQSYSYHGDAFSPAPLKLNDLTLETVNNSRTPLKEIINRPSVYLMNNHSNTAPSCSFYSNPLDAKIESLEREKLEISLKLHLLEEADRSRKYSMEQLESKLKVEQASRTQFEESLLAARQDIIELQHEKEELANEVRRLTRNQQVTSEATSESTTLWTQMTTSSREIKRLEEDNKDLRKEKSELQERSQMLMSHYEKQKEEIAIYISSLKNLQEEKEKSTKAAIELEIVTIEYNNIVTKLATLELLHTDITTQNKIEIDELKEENKMLLQKINQLEDDITRLPPPTPALSTYPTTTPLDCELFNKLKENLLQSETIRRKLHNQLQDLRGNVRVFVRCRPRLELEKGGGSDDNMESCIKCDPTTSTISLIGGSIRGAGQTFSFDHIFGMNANQDDIYSEVNDLVQSSLDGYRVCIFSYGQTGSGKTYTMTGGSQDNDRGIIPRAMEQIITKAMLQREYGWEVSVTLSMLEIYNEELRDLLLTNTITDERNKLKISHANGRVTVQGLEAFPIDTSCVSTGLNQLQDILLEANRTRTTATTAMNEHSSRSHMLFMIEISSYHKASGTSTRGGLRLVDLAGSERLDRTGTLNNSIRLRETVNINKSLSCLADVFLALSNKANHVPFRNSKLTMLLQDCLSGDGKALMLVNVSPTVASAQETYCSLKFANQVSQVELGKAQRFVQTTGMIYHDPPLPPPPPTTTSSISSATTTTTSSQNHSIATSNTSQTNTNETTLKLKSALVVPHHAHHHPAIEVPVSRLHPAKIGIRFTDLATIPEHEEPVRLNQSALAGAKRMSMSFSAHSNMGCTRVSRQSILHNKTGGAKRNISALLATTDLNSTSNSIVNSASDTSFVDNGGSLGAGGTGGASGGGGLAQPRRCKQKTSTWK